MSEIDETTLVAYVDGELDPAASEEVEAALAGDPELRRTVARLRESTALARAAFNHVMYEPMPELPKAAPVEGGADRAAAGAPAGGGTGARHWRWGGGMALAASLAALIIGGVAGHLSTRYSIQQELARIAAARAADHEAAHRTLAQALEKSVSGTTVSWRNPDTGSRVEVTPVRTFRIKSGQYCRQFERLVVIQGETESDQGIACREAGGDWKTRMRYYEG